jgi:23S rRNA U2552 (ribose-2'-O)-methylase RlmE/FtsJ
MSSEIFLKDKNSNVVTDLNLNFCPKIIYEKSEMLEELGFSSNLNNLRNRIDNIKSEVWKKVRWLINDYDFFVKDPIINRAFYKYWEIVQEFNLDYSQEELVIHLAEAPGGFIQASNYLISETRKSKNKSKNVVDNEGFTTVNLKKHKREYNIISMSLNKDLPIYKNYNLPSYNTVLQKSKILLTYGIDNTGDLTNIENIKFLSDLVKKSKKKVSIITADGGFDEGTEFNNKEQLHYSLIIHEIIGALILGNTGTHFVLKMYDIYTRTSLEILYLLNYIYKDIFIFKPKTSRPTNSEKYIVCKYMNADLVTDELLEKLFKLSIDLKQLKNGDYYIDLFKQVDFAFIDKIKEINNRIIENQCSFLNKALQYTDYNVSEKELITINNRKSKIYNDWVEKYNLHKYIYKKL